MKPMLELLLRLDRAALGHYDRTLFRPMAAVVEWRNHRLRLPLGLLCGAEGEFMRLLWMEHKLRSNRPVILVVTATLAAVESWLPSLGAIETWHLRDGERRFYHSADLRHDMVRLDRLLSAAEGRLGRPPAAA